MCEVWRATAVLSHSAPYVLPQVVFGKVVEGLDILKRIGEAWLHAQGDTAGGRTDTHWRGNYTTPQGQAQGQEASRSAWGTRATAVTTSALGATRALGFLL